MTEIIVEDDAVDVSVQNVTIELGGAVTDVDVQETVLYGLPEVDVLAPLAFDNLSGDLSISQANSSSSGFVTAADWNVFNNKQAAGNYLTALSGDASASGPGSATLTLANVNSNVGSFNNVTVNGKGLVTAANNVNYQPAFSSFTANQVLFGAGASTPAQDSNLVWDNTNKRFGIGINPAAKLDLLSNSGTLANFTHSNDASLALNRTNSVYNGLSIQNNGSEKWFVGHKNGAESLVFRNSGTNDVVTIEDGGVANAVYVSASGNVGVGTNSANAKTEIVSNGEQLRLSYDTINRTKFAVNSASGLTVTPGVDSTTAVNITKADGVTSVLNVSTSNSSVGILQNAPTAFLDVPGSTITRASARFRTAANPVTTQDGAFWQNGTHCYMQIAGTRRQLDNSAAGFEFVEVTNTLSTTLIPNIIYHINTATTANLTLPFQFNQNDYIGIVTKGTGGWVITQNSGQTIRMGPSLATTTGTGGSVSTATRYSALALRCTITNTELVLESVSGPMTVV